MTKRTAKVECIRMGHAHFHHQGTRDEQQDQLGQQLWGSKHRFFVIDGMGGIEGGAAIAQQLRKLFLAQASNPVETAHAAIQEWFAQTFSEMPREQLPGAVATIIDVNLDTTTAEVFHLGDTRLYRCRSGVVEQLTTDHVDRNGDPTQDYGLPVIEPQVFTLELMKGDRLLLCSDGVYRTLGRHPLMSLEVYLQHETIEQACTKLLYGCQADFTDNATAWFLEVQSVNQSASTSVSPSTNRWLNWLLVGCLLAGFVAGWLMEEWGLLSNESEVPTDTPQELPETLPASSTQGASVAPQSTEGPESTTDAVDESVDDQVDEKVDEKEDIPPTDTP